MEDVKTMPANPEIIDFASPTPGADVDPGETQEWLDSLDYALAANGQERVRFLLASLKNRAKLRGVDVSFTASTPYFNTIPAAEQPAYPGNRDIERRIKSIIRWNAMAMVIRANRGDAPSVGGHISTYASSATLVEVAFNHFLHGRNNGHAGDQVYFQGHASPGIYARAFLEGRFAEEHLQNFRRELQPAPGLSSYPHPWLMPDFWEFPTVSMGLGPICSLYQARFNRYLHHRGLKDTSQTRVWAFIGDGECDEPETLGAISLAAREELDNLTWVVNCNLQRLDGPVRGNGKIIQDLETIFRGAGWNVIKVIWGSDWDPLLAADETGLLAKRMEEVLDGEYQKYVVETGSYIREHFFGKYPELLELVENYSDERLQRLTRGGHDPEKVYAAYEAATKCTDKPTVILAKTIKGYGLGEAGEGRNPTHNNKKLSDDELREFRTRFNLPLSEDEVISAPFYRPPEESAEMSYLKDRRDALGGPVPARPTTVPTSMIPPLSDFQEFLAGSGDRKMSTTVAFVRLLSKLCKDKHIGKQIVPIVPDESRSFGMEGMYNQVGIYAHAGQLYEPVDSGQLMYYKEAQDGQILEEGITEAGCMASFIAAGTAYSQHAINMIPFFIYYSIFGFQRIGDLVWCAADARAKGFLIGGTSGRTTLNGEGLQHQDGHSHLNAIAFPTVRAYDVCYAYETAVLVLEGMQKLYVDGETAIYYLTVANESYAHPEMPDGAEEGIVRGIYKLSRRSLFKARAKVQLMGSGTITRCVLEAAQLLAERYNIASDVWAVTSYTELARDAQSVERWNKLHPTAKPKKSYLESVMKGTEGPYISASDHVRAWAEQIRPYLPGQMVVLGTDGMGRSESREALRRHFEVDAASIVIATLYELARTGHMKHNEVARAIQELNFDPDKPDPYFA